MNRPVLTAYAGQAPKMSLREAAARLATAPAAAVLASLHRLTASGQISATQMLNVYLACVVVRSSGGRS